LQESRIWQIRSTSFQSTYEISSVHNYLGRCRTLYFFSIPNSREKSNTHSDELDQDLTKVVTLENNDGNLYKPSSWEGSPLGGHHREGTLLFNPISPQPGSISLKIKEIGGVAERSFLWEF